MSSSLRNLDLNLLVALDALLAERHVSRAAEKLGISQPTLSRMLGRMRDMFGDPLLVRGRHGLEPTSRARELMPRLRDILDQMQQVLELQAFDPATSNRQFRLRATNYVVQTFLPAIMARFYREAPGASLAIADLKVHDLEAERAPETDLAVCSDVISIPDTYMQKKLCSDHFVCVMSADHPLAGGQLTLDGYLDYPHALVTMGGGPHSSIDDKLNAMGKARQKALFVQSGLAGMAMIRGSHLLMSNCMMQVRQYAPAMGVVWQDLPFDFPAVDYFLAWHPVHHHHEAHRWFRKLVYTEIRQLMETGQAA